MDSNKHVVCPFCPLHCDDLSVDVDGGVNVDCPIARDAFPNALKPAAPRIGEDMVSLAEMAKHVRRLVVGSVPVAIASAATLATAKSLEQLHSGGKIEWMIDPSTARISLQQTISRDGMIGATFAEVRRHADQIWIIGNCDRKLLPRIDELTTALVTNPNRIYWPGGVSARQLGDLLDAIRRDERPKESPLVKIYDAASRAAYFAAIWVDDGFDPVEADVASGLLLELIALLNDATRRENRRAVLVTFDEGQTARSVSLWRRNEIPCNIANVLLKDDSIIIRLGESVGSAMRVSVQLGGRDPGNEFAEVYVPTAVEGIHRADTVIRGDGSVTLPLKPFAASDLPTSREWFAKWFDG